MTVIINGTTGVTSVNGSAAAPSVTGTDTDTGIVYGTNTVSIATGGTERAVVDSSGNLGLGVTPSAWRSTSKSIQLTGGCISPFSTNALNIGQNFYFNSSDQAIYSTTAAASSYVLVGNEHRWNIAPSGTAGNAITFTQAMTLDSSGRLGIGETSPSALLDLKAAQGRIKLTSSTGTNNTLLAFTNTGGNAYVGLDSSGGGLTAAYALNIFHEGAYPITFATNNLERARIDSSGNLGVGTTSPSAKLHTASSGLGDTGGIKIQNTGSGGATFAIWPTATVNGEGAGKLIISGPSGNAVTVDSSGNLLVGQTTQFRTGDRLSVVGTSNNVASFNNTSNVSGYGTIASYLFANGGNTSTYHFWANTSAVGNWYLYGNGTSSFSSDERLKKNIETARDGYADDLCKLRVVKYNWKDSEDGAPRELGLVAQEVEQIFPGLVQDDINPVEEGGETFKQLKYSVLPFMLLKAIQEQQAIITQLQADVAALKA